jgi:lactate dehydrogenase-like 2-hydroxyacid dehydrogenase
MSDLPLPVTVLLAGKLMPSALALLQRSVMVLDGRDPAERERLVAEHAGSIRGIATNGHDGASRALIAALPKLEIIACFSAGVDGIDVAAAAERGIPVTATSDALADDVADVAIAHCLNLLRGMCRADAFVRAGAWSKGEFPLMRTMKGRRVGILGMGTIGKAISTRATAMGSVVAYTSRTAKPALPYRFVPSLAGLAAESDILIVCCPATPETRHIVNAPVLSALGSDGYVVNIARGSVVDEAALVSALQAGTIAGAGLDVFEDEPRPLAPLLSMENVTLSPHIGSGTDETRAAMGRSMVDSLVTHFRKG